MLVHGIYHAGLTVRNIERSVAFYRDLLGLELVRCQESDTPYISQLTGLPGAHLKVAYLRPPTGDGPFLELIEYIAPVGTPVDTTPCNPGTGHICFFVDDLDSAYAALRAHGVPFASPPVGITAGFHAGAKSVYLKDPDNVTVELFQR
jgi:catechol 2,3-dioxygenase-like lactoylglutathione lyase family enzyme